MLFELPLKSFALILFLLICKSVTRISVAYAMAEVFLTGLFDLYAFGFAFSDEGCGLS